MIKIFILIILIPLLYGNSFSQFVLNSSHNPVIGDSVVSKAVDTTGIFQGDAGANKLWNFQNLNFIGSPSIEYFVSPLSSSYFSQFPDANILSFHVFDMESTSMPHFYRVSDTAFAQLGYVFPNFPVIICKYSNPFLRNHYPVFYGSQNISNYSSTTTTGTMIEKVWGTKTEKCDGYGTIILPSGYYTNAIRIKTVDDEMDTIKINGVVSNIYHNTSENYFWYVQGYKYPLFVISYQNYSNSYSKNVSCYVLNEPIGIIQSSSSIPDKYSLYQNYPNPFNPETKIRFDLKESGLVNLKIYNVLGKEVKVLVSKHLKQGEYEVSFSSEQLPGGTYFYTLVTGNFGCTKKMIIVK